MFASSQPAPTTSSARTGATKTCYLSLTRYRSACYIPEWFSNSGTANVFKRVCSGLALKGHGKSNLEASANNTKSFIKAALSKISYQAGTKAMWAACYELAASRRAIGAVNLSRRPARLTRFSVYNVARAREVLKAEKVTFTERTLPDGTSEIVLDREEAGYTMSLCQTPTAELSGDGFTASTSVLSSVANAADTSKVKIFHERMLGFTHLRTFTVNAGSAPDGQDDGLMHVMGLPNDDQRVNIITEGLNSQSSMLLARRC
ncbi:hypothetical protein E4U19_007516 [Claviceps sp. Clav32 group G5]|nr:hypothetical protein E4U19_007516 [Claviceps sp. Clav32 group G5]